MIKKKFKRGDKVSITWIDAMSPHPAIENVEHINCKEDNWITILEIEDFCNQALELESVGILVFKGKQYTAIASSVNDGCVCNSLLIPNTSILNIRKLK